MYYAFSRAVYLYMAGLSKLNALKASGKKDRVIFSSAYAGQPVLLMALYEKGDLRQDVLAFLDVAKQQGIYVLCVNTLKLADPDRYRHTIDCYIERYNFGRDFGSYQSGFSHLYQSGIAAACPRMMLVNDSIFFSAQHSRKFISEMFASPVEVLGATENHEDERHLGSFCIALNGSILNSPELKRYWHLYKCSDLRTVVIRRGEFGLSKVLKRLVSSPDQFRALYDTTRAREALENDPVLLEQGCYLARDSERVHWPRFSFTAVADRVAVKYLRSSATVAGFQLDKAELGDVHNVDLSFFNSMTGLEKYVSTAVVDSVAHQAVIQRVLRREVISAFLASFIHGSQLHQNNIFLHRIGLPLIKLDGLLRGVFSVHDVETLADQLDRDQAEGFRRQMYARPFGSDTLRGWKRAAFFQGLL